MKNCSLLINSCDAYKDTWPLFFTCLKHQWENLDCPIFLNTESEDYNDPHFKISVVHGGKREWGARLATSLRRIKTDYVIVLLDDFFINTAVDCEAIEKHLRQMADDPEIACIHLNARCEKIRSECESPELEDCVRIHKDEYGVVNCGPSLWRREDLLRITHDYVNAWLFEAYGCFLASNSNKKFYVRSKAAGDVFLYGREYGGAIHKNIWVGCVVRPIMEKYGVEMDLSKRGVVEDWTKEGEGYYKITLHQKIKNRIVLCRILTYNFFHRR